MSTDQIGPRGCEWDCAYCRQMARTPVYTMTLKDGTRYTLGEDGRVLARSDGPKGWDYSGEWVILGFSTRAHSSRLVSLKDAANGADVGQGWVHDLDHGTHRMWGSPKGRRLQTISRIPAPSITTNTSTPPDLVITAVL